MSESLDLDQDPVFDKSIILDSIQLTDPILIDNKLGDTNGFGSKLNCFTIKIWNHWPVNPEEFMVLA